MTHRAYGISYYGDWWQAAIGKIQPFAVHDANQKFVATTKVSTCRSYQRRLGCLFRSLFKLITRKHQRYVLKIIRVGNPYVTSGFFFPHKGPVISLSCFNRPVAQLPHCTSPISHNAPLCNSAHFCHKVMHCGIFVWFTVGFVRWIYSQVSFTYRVVEQSA